MHGKKGTELRPTARQVQEPTERSRRRRTLRILASVGGLLIAGIAIYVASAPEEPLAVWTQDNRPLPIHSSQRVESLDKLLKMTPEQLEGVDIAEMSLLCATGLPGAERLGVGRCLARLDEWATRVRIETGRHLYRAQDPRWAEHYRHSEKWLRAEMLAQVLHQDCGVHYNAERKANVDFTNSRDLFIHGMIDDANGGTCASMPVLYVAVGRRLGYPLKLVQTKAHIFVRWDDGKDRFNIETTSDGGTESPQDEYYQSWPEKWTEAEVKSNRWLVSLSAAEELASFLGSRGHCLLDNQRASDAMAAYFMASRLAPLDPAYQSWMRHAQSALDPPTLADTARRTSLQHDPQAELQRIQEFNRQTMQRLQRPQPPREPYRTKPPGVPAP